MPDSHHLLYVARRRSRAAGLKATAWLAFLGIVGAAVVVYFFLPDGVQSIAYDGIGVAAGLVMLVGTFVNGPDRRFAWTLLAFGILISAVGDIVYGDSQPMPSPADMFYIVSYSILGLGMLGLARDPDRPRRGSSLTDAVAIAAAIAVASIVFLLAPAGHPRDAGLAARAVAIGYPVMDLALLAMLVRAMGSDVWRSPPIALLGAAIVLRLVADTGFALLGFGTAYTVGAGVDAAFLLSYACFGAALLHPGLRGWHPPTPGRRIEAHRSEAGDRAGTRTSGPIVIVGDRGPVIVAVHARRVVRTRSVIAWAGGMLLVLATLALFLSLAWRTPEVLLLGGAYGMTGMLMVIASAITT